MQLKMLKTSAFSQKPNSGYAFLWSILLELTQLCGFIKLKQKTHDWIFIYCSCLCFSNPNLSKSPFLFFICSIRLVVEKVQEKSRNCNYVVN